MPKKKKFISAKWIAVIILVAVICVSSVAVINYVENSNKPIVPAVHLGDVFYYNITGAYISFTSGANPDEEYPGILQLNQTNYYKVNVTGIHGTVVSLSDDWVFNNGTDIHQTQTINIANGKLGDEGGFWGLYAPNLRVNDLILPKGVGGSNIRVNSTFAQKYADSNRQTDYWRISGEQKYTLDPTQTTFRQNTVDVSFDKKTGIMTAMTNFMQYNNPQMNIAIAWSLTKSTVWNV